MAGRIVTFYSYKGGTGRSMALANIAWILASNGNKVIVIDWDLEAPGLHRYFRPFLLDPTFQSTGGVKGGAKVSHQGGGKGYHFFPSEPFSL